MSTVAEALKAREERKKKEFDEKVKASNDKVSSALESRKSRMQNNAQNAVSDLAKRVNEEIEISKGISTPSWSKDAYNNAWNSTKDSVNNISQLIREVESYKSYINEDAYNTLSSTLSTLKDNYDSYLNFSKTITNFDSEEEFNKWYEGAKRKAEEEQKILGADDFEEYYQKGKTDDDNNDFIMEIFGKPVGESNYIEHYRKKYADSFEEETYGGGLTSKNASYALAMTDDEVKIYDYYLGKYGKKKAEEYLDSIKETLNQRVGSGMYKTVEGNNLLETTFAFSAGLDQFISGVGNLDNLIMGTEADPTSATQYASSMIREDLDGAWGVAYDLVNTTSNMLPSILVGSFTGGLGGTLTLGASAMGNAYAEMRNLGYDEWQARGYGFLVGASETVLQYALGGISKLGGKLSGNVIANFVSKLDNAIARTAIQLGGNMASEGLEEAIQTVLEPAFKAWMTGETFEAPEWEEVWYSALLGALSAGVMEGVPTIAGTVFNSYQTNKVYGSEPQALVTEALEIDPENAHAQRMQARLDSGKNVSGYQLNRLVDANEQALVKQDTAKMKSAVEARLTELGEKGDISKIADVIVKARSGEKLTSAERAILTESKYGRRVSTEMNPDMMKTGKYTSSWAENIGTERINSDAYNKELLSLANEQAGVATDKDSTETPTKNPTAKENATEAKFEASTDGKTRIGDMEVTIKEIASVKDGEVILRLDDDTTVNARDVDFASTDDVLLYENVADMNLNAATANAFVKGYDPSISVGQYVNGFREAYRYGEYGYPVQEMSAKGFSSMLTESQKSLAYNLGKTDAKYKVQSKQEKIASTSAKNTAKDSQKTSKKGKLHNTLKPTNETQRASLKALGVLAEALNIDIYTFESPVDAKGNRLGENGSYDPVTRTLRIDLFAGANGKGTMLFTAAHELTHHIRETLPAKFKAFADFLFEQYGEKGISVSKLIAKKISDLKDNGRITPNMTEAEAYDLAYEEVVADACESFLADGEAVAKIAELKAKDKTLWEAIKDFITKLVARIKSAYEGLNPDSVEGNLVAKMLDSAEQLKAMWVEALVETSEVGGVSAQLAEAGIGFDSETRSVYSLRYSPARKDADGNVVDNVTVGKKEFNIESIAQLVSKATGRSIEDARKWVKSEVSIANLVMKNPEFLDFEADNRYEAIKKNSDYPQGTVDLSNLCPKRTEFTSMFDMLQKKYPNRLFTASDVAAMRNILKGKDITVACGACFVEDRRQLLGEIADTYIGMWKEAVETGKPLQKTNAEGNKITLKVTAALAKQYGLTKGADIIATDSYIPTQYDLTTYEGFKLLEKNHPIIAMGFNRYNNSRGQQAGRLIEGRAEYNRQILGWTDAKVRSVNNNGGLRIFSFSDFEVVHLLDLVQVIIDCAARGVKIQGYTKIPAFAKLVRDTGIKINRSLIPKGQTGIKVVNGKEVLDIDLVEGIDINDENFLDESDNPNVGNIIIGINPKQIGIAMLDDFIDYIIPFHTNKSKDICKELGVGEWVNYKESQHDKDIATGKASKHNVNIYTQVINKYHPKNKVEFVNAFLKECKAQKKIPRYSEFLNKEYKEGGAYRDEYGTFDYTYREGYHKFLVDFKMFDKNGNILPQGNIVPELNDKFMAELLKAEVDKKQNYEFPQEVYDQLDKEFGENKTKYSDRTTDSVSNRSLLANALEGTAQNDIERNKLKEYKGKIALIESEQAKLADVRKRANDIRFTKGRTAEETKKMKALDFEANQIANRINTYDKQLLNLESTKALKDVLQREKQMAYKRAEKKGREALKAQREKDRERNAKTQRELMNRYTESRKKNIEGRKKTEMRYKIKKINSELNTLLLNPTSKKHIKEELRKEVANALDAFNMDTVGAEERLAEINRKLQKASDPYEIEHLLESYRRISLQGEKLADRLNALKSAYEKIKATDDIELNLSYQEAIHNSIEAVSKEVGNTSIRNMTLEQLEMVYDLFKMIRQTISNANKAFKEQKGQTIMQMAEAVNDQVRTVGGQPYKRNVISSWLQKEGWHLLKPYVAFRTIGSVTLTNMYKELRNGEDTFYNDVKEAQAFIEEQYKKHGYNSWDMKQTKTFTAKSGKSFDLTLEQMMTLYAYYQREKSHKHIMEGGIVFEDALLVEKNKWGIPMKYEVTTKDAFNLSEETFKGICDYLEENHKDVVAYVKEMQKYLSEVMGAKGNDVSMELLGVKLFKEEFYLPIKSSKYYMDFKAEEAGEVKLKSPAFSKETVPHANNPIVLHNFTDLWAEHINDMSMYHSFVLALEDFTRVYNYKTKTDAKVETMDTKATIETAYPGATAYISKFLKDLNGGVRGETVGWAEKLTSLSKKGAVLGSASVAIQQPSAIVRAMAYVNPKYFVTTTNKSLNLAKHNQDMAELKKYAPIAGIKEMGRFDVGMGKGTVEWIKSNETVMGKVEDILGKAPEFMDEVTWVAIWNAVKRETVHTHKDLRPNSEEFLKVAGERFTDVISLSQVYDSVFSRSDLMRNKSLVAKWITSFMAEPTTTLNMLVDAWVQGKRTGSWKGFVKVASKPASAVLGAIVLNSALKAIVMAGRDDDEDESYAEKYLEHFFGDLKDNLNPLTLIPVVKDVLSIFDGYSVERMDMSLISDLKQALDAFDSDNKTAYEKWSGLIGAISAMFGVPVKNVERDIRAVITTIFGDSEATTKAGLGNAIEEGWTGDKKSNGQQLYEAMLAGDTEQIERVEGRFDNQQEINSAIRKALRENDSRIKEAAEAVFNGRYSEYDRIFNAILSEGNFKEADIKAAIDSEVNEMKPKEEKEPTESKDESRYEVGYVFDSAMSGDIVMAIAMKEDIIRTHEANGKDRYEAEASFNNSFTNYVKKHYDEGNISAYEAENMLVNYAGKTSDDAASKIQYWDFKTRYPDYDLSEDAVKKYYSDVEPYGIGVAVYYDYSKQRAKCKGVDANGDGKTDSGSVKSEVMAVINSLPITNAQKDALYYLNGWSASTIWEAPWH